MQNSIIYEQPLNERVRTFLRLEHLFYVTHHHMEGCSEYDYRAAITGLLNISDLLSRSDLRADIIKELDRHLTTINSLSNNPNVDQPRLLAVINNITGLLDELKKTSYQPGLNIRQDEFISTIRQRSTIPGGSCNFDLPNYHFWLHKTQTDIKADLNYWKSDLNLIYSGLQLVLDMIRNSATPVQECAVNGFFQKPIDSAAACQLIRVFLPDGSKYYPEISGGKHRFTIRFLEQTSTQSRPTQVQKDISFELHCCIL